MKDEIAKLVKEWLRYAESDLITARYMFEDVHPKQTEISAFHCQQAAEKAIKAYLVSIDVEPPKIHDLDLLCHLCIQYDVSFQTISADAATLTPFAIAARYPKQLVSDENEVRYAINKAQQVYDFCTAKIEGRLWN